MDGIVSAVDEISGFYSIHHDLSVAEVARAQELANKVRSGTHEITAEHVLPKPHLPTFSRVNI